MNSLKLFYSHNKGIRSNWPDQCISTINKSNTYVAFVRITRQTLISNKQKSIPSLVHDTIVGLKISKIPLFTFKLLQFHTNWIRWYGSKTSHYITILRIISVLSLKKVKLTFPCHTLLRPHWTTFGNDIATLMITIDGRHSYHILIENLWKYPSKIWPKFCVRQIRKIYLSIDISTVQVAAL